MWIKICGITSLEDASLAIDAGADAIGFVFAESPRRVTPDTVREIVKKLPASVEKIGVFVAATADEMGSAIESAGLTGVQFQAGVQFEGSEGGVTAEALRARVGDSAGKLRVLRVVHHDGDQARFAAELRRMWATASGNGLDAVLIDTGMAGKQGGTGSPFDWAGARETFLESDPHLRLIVAGGLRPENVCTAVRTLRPWGVDVSSGVEAGPGRKDSGRVAAFIREARAAAVEAGKADGNKEYELVKD